MVLKSKVYPDEDNFTSEHDDTFLSLLERWREYVRTLSPDLSRWALADGKIVGEPRLDGYPPVFPDAIATGNFLGIHHKGLDRMKGYFPKEPDPTVSSSMWIYCEECDSVQEIHTDYPKFDFKDKLDWAVAKSLLRNRDEGYAYGGSEKERQKRDERDTLIEKQFKEDRDNAIKEWDKNRILAMRDRWQKAKQLGEINKVHRGPRFKVIFEIKPKIDSVGRVLRQLQEYRVRTKPHPNAQYVDEEGRRVSGDYLHFVVLVTNDSRYDDVFSGQGFQIYHPEVQESAKGGPDTEARPKADVQTFQSAREQTGGSEDATPRVSLRLLSLQDFLRGEMDE